MSRIKVGVFSLVLITLFLYPILPQYVYITGSVNVVNGLLAVFILLYILLCGKFTKITSKDIPLYWLFLLIMAVSYYVDAGLLKTATYSMSFIVLPWILITVINTEKRFIRAIDILILAGAFIGILGIIEAALKINFIQFMAREDIEFFHEIRYGLLRIMTTFGQPIAYGLYQVFVIVLINYRKSISNCEKRLNICYAISVLNIFMSVSRIAIIAYILVQILMTYKGSKKKFVNYLVIAMIGLMFFLIVSTSAGFKIPLIDDLLETLNQLLAGNTKSSGSTVGFGDRFELWTWVYLSMGDKWLAGHGPTAEFAYKVYEWQTKKSIENQYLNILWHNGFVGLISMLLSYSSILAYSFKRRNNFLTYDKGCISFNSVVFFMMLVYYIVEFGIQESDISRIYTVFVALMIAYNRIEVMNRKGVNR